MNSMKGSDKERGTWLPSPLQTWKPHSGAGTDAQKTPLMTRPPGAGKAWTQPPMDQNRISIQLTALMQKGAPLCPRILATPNRRRLRGRGGMASPDFAASVLVCRQAVIGNQEGHREHRKRRLRSRQNRLPLSVRKLCHPKRALEALACIEAWRERGWILGWPQQQRASPTSEREQQWWERRTPRAKLARPPRHAKTPPPLPSYATVTAHATHSPPRRRRPRSGVLVPPRRSGSLAGGGG